jgi:hypothetical protein
MRAHSSRANTYAIVCSRPSIPKFTNHVNRDASVTRVLRDDGLLVVIVALYACALALRGSAAERQNQDANACVW